MKPKGSKNKKGVSLILLNGYHEIFKPEHPVAKKNGYVRLHRMIAYDAGLLTDLSMEVHHKNGIKTDNRIENLEVLPKEKHTSITWKGKKRGEWATERKLAKSKQMKGNQNWKGGREVIGNIYENPNLLDKEF